MISPARLHPLTVASALFMENMDSPLQFTAMNALTYSDIARANTSNATTFYAVAQQFSLSAGIAMLSVLQFAWLDSNAASSVVNRRKPAAPQPVAEGPAEL